ncbi:MAG: hypothetical protein KGZ58_02715 [Ignavibacteriales bacterium]|nr:hypothetical protein [Ignavibacteriales bacterium]
MGELFWRFSVNEMFFFLDFNNRKIRLTDERLHHIETDHLELIGQGEKISEVLAHPDIVVQSRTDNEVELFYKFFQKTPVTSKYLCVAVKTTKDSFILTTYFTDTIKKGKILWTKT